MVAQLPRGKSLMVVKDPNSHGFAIDLIKFNEAYRAAFSYIFGDTIVMKDLTSARPHIGGVRMVTLDGQLIEAPGAIIGGAVEKSTLKFGRTTQSDLDKIQQAITNALDTSKKLCAELQIVQKELISLEEQIRQFKLSDESSDEKRKEFENTLQNSQIKIQNIIKELSNKTLILNEKTKKLTENREESKNIEAKMKEITLEIETCKREIQKLAPKEIGENLKKLESETFTLKNSIDTIKSKLESLTSQININKERETELKTKIEEFEKKLEENLKSIDEYTTGINKLQMELNALQKLEESSSTLLKNLNAKREELNAKIAELEKNRMDKNNRINNLEILNIELNTTKQKLEEELTQIEAECKTYNIQLTDESLPPISEIQKNIAILEAELNALGPVNLKAIEDFEFQSKRYMEYSDDLKRLENEKSELLRLINELNSKKKIEFEKVYNAVNENLQNVYAEISDGGSAWLELENPNDPLNGGLHIKVKLKNKKAHRLASLSGGEKSLVALAFIFAIQRYDPSPFYVLDEADMSLDALNTEKVAYMIKKYSQTAQFLVISLRKATLKEADNLYIVYNPGNGISEVKGVKLAELGEIEDKQKPLEEIIKDTVRPERQSEMRNAEFGIRNSECEMRNVECGTQNTETTDDTSTREHKEGYS